jgi:hypothetical protein
LGVTRPDISYAVHILSQFVTAPTQIHYSHLLRVLRYLRGTINRRLFRALALFTSKPILMLLGLATPLNATLFLPTVFSLVVLSLLGRLRSRLQYLVRVQRRSCELWLLLQQRLLGSDGYLRILVFQFLCQLHFCVTVPVPST